MRREAIHLDREVAGEGAPVGPHTDRVLVGARGGHGLPGGQAAEIARGRLKLVERCLHLAEFRDGRAQTARACLERLQRLALDLHKGRDDRVDIDRAADS
ncbi:MAG: hypothetical protein R3E83_23470 [Burkholderiaceae bacterium]